MEIKLAFKNIQLDKAHAVDSYIHGKKKYA